MIYERCCRSKELLGSICKFSHGITFHEVDKTPITSQLWEMRKSSSKAANELMSSKNAEVIAKTIDSSRLVIKYPFTTDLKLRDMYVDHTGQLLMGKILEDLDAFAGNIAHAHCDDDDPATHRLSLVTASVDKIVIKNPMPLTTNLVMSGQVAWVGKSSLDVLVTIEKPSVIVESNNEGGVLLSSFFKYVARDKNTGKAASVNQLTGLNSTDQLLFEKRQLLANSRKQHMLTSNQSDPLYTSEIIDMVNEGCAVDDMPTLCRSHSILMKRTQYENTFICQPQNGNTSGRVFGGFIMHRAFDLALTTGYLFGGSSPLLKEVDRIEFRKPIEIGDLVRIESRVVYATSPDDYSFNNSSNAVIEVTCHIVKPENYATLSYPLRKILPVSSEEAAALISGRKLLADLSNNSGTV